jgi:hypothetical protein
MHAGSEQTNEWGDLELARRALQHDGQHLPPMSKAHSTIMRAWFNGKCAYHAY